MTDRSRSSGGHAIHPGTPASPALAFVLALSWPGCAHTPPRTAPPAVATPRPLAPLVVPADPLASATTPEDLCTTARTLAARPVARLDHVLLGALCDAPDDLPADELRRNLARLAEPCRSPSPGCRWFQEVVTGNVDAEPPRFGRIEDAYLVHPSRRDDPRIRLSVETTGALRHLGWVLFLRGVAGPDEIVRGAFRDQEPSRAWLGSGALDVLAHAAEEPDFYLWNDPAVHALTPDTDAQPAATAEAREAWRRFVQKELGASRDAACAGSHDAALVHLAAALHAVADLPVNLGRSRAERACLDVIEARPRPEELRAIGAAKRLVREALNWLRGATVACGARLDAFQAAAPLPSARVAAMLGHPERDFGSGSFFRFRRLAGRHRERHLIGEAPLRRWCWLDEEPASAGAAGEHLPCGGVARDPALPPCSALVGELLQSMAAGNPAPRGAR